MVDNTATRPSGMRAFYVIWLGQFGSLLGSGMTQFAITLWAWQATGSATTLALVATFGFAPVVFMSPIAGALVDRWDRKLVMMLSDLGAGVSTIALFLLSLTGNLDVWHLYIAAAFAGAFNAFQFPAYSAAISTMVDKENFARTSAMLGLAQSASGILAPIAAAAVYGIIGLNGILGLDIITFSFAIGTLLFVHIPPAKRSADGAASRGNLWTESVYGFRYIIERPSMFGLQMSFFAMNLILGAGLILLNPLVLARTGNNENILAIVSSMLGAGGIAGGVLMSWWGGFKQQRVRGVFFAFVASGIATAIIGFGQGVVVWGIGSFLFTATLPVMNASNQAIWQSKVAPDVQGKVFAARRVIANISNPVAMILGGVLADNVFEPAMQPPDGALIGIFGGFVGVGEGTGFSVLFILMGIAAMGVGIVAYATPRLRNVERIVPDFDELSEELVPIG